MPTTGPAEPLLIVKPPKHPTGTSFDSLHTLVYPTSFLTLLLGVLLPHLFIARCLSDLGFLQNTDTISHVFWHVFPI